MIANPTLYRNTTMPPLYANYEQLVLLIHTLVEIYFHETSSCDGAADISRHARSFIEVILLQ